MRGVVEWRDAEPELQFLRTTELTARLSFADALIFGFSPAPAILLTKDCWSSIKGHLETSRRELGGLLLGSVFVDHTGAPEPSASAILIGEAIASTDFENSSVSLRMNTQLWEQVRSRTSEAHMVVGWYHSHPNLGAFFSGTDRYTQKHFFPKSYNIGLVVDPIRKERAWFLGANSLSVDDRRIVQVTTWDGDSHVGSALAVGSE
jgi:proteasome lid subunit RPN8/RPN11